MKRKVLILFAALFINNIEISAQLNTTTVGDAVDLGGNCFLITDNLQNQSGGVWYDNPIDFSNDFTINYQNNFGDNDDGADGMALVFKTTPDAVIGGDGQYVGYGGIKNSLIVEFDTWKNYNQGDPFYDHLSIMKNGNPSHDSADNLAGPIVASSSNDNIEDGNFHEVKIAWDAAAQVFSVFFDCQLRLTITEDIKNTIFFGDSSVYFGFVGATGGATNRQQVCFNSISFVDNLVIPENITICLEEKVKIDATIPSGISYSWSPTTGVSDANIANPDFSPIETTDYTITITDNCGELTNYTVTITVSSISTPIFTQIDPICSGETLSNLPSTSVNGLSGTWSPAMNNTATTTYTFIPGAGECSTDPAQMTVIVNPIITPTFTQVGAICAGETLSDLPTISANGVSGTWSPVINNTSTTTYTFAPDASETCAVIQSMNITVNPIRTPAFTQVDAICNGEALSDLPVISNNGITGTWLPAINNTAITTYTFTPDASETCAVIQSMTITVSSISTPIFTQIDPICSGEALSNLPSTSANGLSGTWSPAMNNTATTTYTFIPGAGECSTDPAQMTVIVNAIITPTFTQVGAICAGEILSDLPVTSNNGITGTWLPAINNTATTKYTFTPDALEICAVIQSMTITVNPIRTPAFTQVDPICSGEALSDLPVTSNNGITGTWLPALNNMATTTYTFTPDVSEICVKIITLEIAVNPIIIPIFTQVDAICSGAAFSDLPTTSNNGVLGGWSPAMNNTLTTTYTFIPDLSETCALNQRMTITVNQTVIPIFDPVAAICEGELLTNLPTTSKNGVLGGWSPAMNNMATTTYTFTPDASEICAEITTLEIGVHEIINSNLDVRIVVNKLDYNQSVEVDVANAVGFYEYKLDSGLWQDSNLFENLIVGKHSIAAREKSGCNMELTIWFLLIDYPRFFTPNGDGINDTWNVKGLESQPEAVITIFDRFGKTLSVFKADELGWNGKSARSNSYWFKVSYFEMEDRPKTVMLSFSLFR